MAEACWLPAAAPELFTDMQASPMALLSLCSADLQKTLSPWHQGWLVEQSPCNCHQINWTVVRTAQVHDWLLIDTRTCYLMTAFSLKGREDAFQQMSLNRNYDPVNSKAPLQLKVSVSAGSFHDLVDHFTDTQEHHCNQKCNSVLDSQPVPVSDSAIFSLI